MSCHPSTCFSVLSASHEVCTWTKETRLWFLRAVDPGHRKIFFKQRFQLIWLIWNCWALIHTHTHTHTLAQLEIIIRHQMQVHVPRNAGQGGPHWNIVSSDWLQDLISWHQEIPFPWFKTILPSELPLRTKSRQSQISSDLFLLSFQIKA